MASTSQTHDVTQRPGAPSASRRSISNQAASASRALGSAAATTYSSPYTGLPNSPSSSSVSSSRRSLSGPGRNSFSHASIKSPSSSSLIHDDSLVRPRRSGSSSKTRLSGDNASAPRRPSNQRKRSVPIAEARSEALLDPELVKPAPYPVQPISPVQRLQRHHSDESLRLDLDGLDLGGNHTNFSPHDEASQRHMRSRSNNADISPFAPAKHSYGMTAYNGLDVDMDRYCTSCGDEGRPHEPINGIEDSFSVHLRAECSDYRQIMSSQAILGAAAEKEKRMRNSSLEPIDPQRQRGYSISHGQVLGGFASLGLGTEGEVEPAAPTRQQPVRNVTKGSTDSSEAPATPIEWRDSFGTLCAPTSTPPPKWAHLTARPCNPLDPLDVLSIEEMGLHSLDIGSLNDWEGCKLSAEILCPINGHQRIEWSVAQTTRRNKKWVVVPNNTITCGQTDPLPAEVQAERTVVVSGRSLWADEQEAALASTAALGLSVPKPSGLGPVAAPLRSSAPFSGKAGFELRLLRPTTGKMCPPIYLANASTHRYLHQYRLENTPLSIMHANGYRYAGRPANGSQPVYPVLRRSRSRPYLRHSQVPLRRSRSKPYLKYSAAEELVTGGSSSPRGSPRGNPEEFAPALAGDPLVRALPVESWPSARSRPSASLSSFDSMSTSDAGSDSSSDDAEPSAASTRESVMGSMTSASYDASVKRGREGEQQGLRSQAIPMAVTANRDRAALRSLSPSSSASRNRSSPSEGSAALGWPHQQQASEADSWQGTSPTTASASSMSASATSKQSRSRKGLQRALQKGDKVLNSWFKRKPDAGATPAGSPMTERDVTQRAPPTVGSLQQMQGNGSPSQAISSVRSSFARDSHESGVTGSTPLTETALESFQKAIFRPASPESTIMGSRRGSEALTQKTVEPSTALDRSSGEKASHGNGVDSKGALGAAHRRGSAEQHRSAVNATLSNLYGWDQHQTSDKMFPRPVTRMSNGSSAFSTPSTSFQDLDERNALLGIDAVPAGALTMLVPLPLVGRNKAQDAVRYMRVNFVPFGNYNDSFETNQGQAAPGLANATSPGSEGESALSHSLSTGSGGFGGKNEASGAAKTGGESSWKRKLGLQSKSGAQPTANGVGAAKSEELTPQSPPLSGTPEAFRITAVVHDAPWTPAASVASADPRLPEPGTFPVVLGYCNGSKGLEMVPEGWGALKLAGVPEPTKEDGSPLDGTHPLNAVMDLIIAACTAVMDV